MEAVPRLPMTSFELKVVTEKVSFGPKIKQYISNFYHEDGESYSEEIHNLEVLRGVATRPVIDVTGCQSLKKYYCQLNFLKSRFPMEEGQPCAVYYAWKDCHSNMTCSFPDINFELACILYNIGALHSQLGAMDSRSSPDGMKMACTHFQCAVWAFQTIRENFSQFVVLLLPSEMVLYMQHVCLAQAQECILEKSMLDNRKATIIAKVAVQVVDYYKQALAVLQTGGEEGSFTDLLGSKVYKRWVQYISFKITYHKCVSLLYQGQQSEEQQKMGERVSFYQAALEQLEEARKLASNMQNKQQLEDALVFTLDVVEGKRKAAKNENEFIYHEEVPEKDALQEVKGASLVKGIPFNINDVEVSGPDIFARLVPMEAHEASSMYSEQKAQILRRYGELIDVKDQALSEFMSSLQLEFLSQIHQAKDITQDLIDRAAAISARPNATQDLVAAMGKLSNTYHEVEAMLNDINILLQEEEKNEQEYQKLMGKRPPSIIATDLSREAAKYQEAHNKACESNQNLHKAMLTHIANLKILAMPIPQLKSQIPAIELPNPNVDDTALREIMNLLAKVEEMKSQRNMLWGQLRDAVHSDDITGILATRQLEQSLEQLFQKELEKHHKLTNLLEQNLSAQDNICKALVDSYARFASSRKYLQDILNKRTNTISALITSYDTYEDLLLKANKGLEFYSKLETNVTKLLGRIKSSCKVQQEERDQILLKNGQAKIEPVTPSVVPPSPLTSANPNRAPKLKDYLDSIKSEKAGHTDSSQYTVNYNTTGQIGSDSSAWPPSVRPTPLGSEVTTDTSARKIENRFGVTQEQYPPSYISPYPQTGYQYPGVDTSKDLQQSFIDRMAALSAGKSKDYPASSYLPNLQQPYQYSYDAAYSSAIPAATNTMQNISTNPTSYQTVSTTQYPYVTTSEQYSNYNTSLPQGNNNIPSNNYSEINQAGMSTLPSYGYGNQNHPQQGPTNAQQYIPTSLQTGNASNQTAFYYQTPTTISASSNQAKSVQHSTQQYNYQNQQTSQYIPSSVHYTGQTQNMQYGAVTQQYAGQDQQLTISNQQPSQQYQAQPHQNLVQGDPYGSYYSNISDKVEQYGSAATPTSTNYTSLYGGFPYSGTATGNINPGLSNPTQQLTNTYGTNYNTDAANLQTFQTNTPNYPPSTETTQNQQDSTGINYGTYTMNPADNTATYTNPNMGSNYTATTMNYNTTPNSDTANEKQNVNYTNQYSTATYMQYGTNPQTMGMQYETPQMPATGINTYQNYYGNYTNGTAMPPQTNVPTTSAVTSTSTTQVTPKKETNIDLLSGLDFSISQVPLVPQQNASIHSIKETNASNVSPFKSVTKLEEKPEIAETKEINLPTKLEPRNPFESPSVVAKFAIEVEKFEKFVDDLPNKSLNGPTHLDIKWKEVQEADVQKKIISVARCYPMKNRFPDILPYDYTRVELKSTKDDYINASHIKDISKYAPTFIATQAPMTQTFNDFWTLIWEQEVELIVCLLSDNELGTEIYWPKESGRDLMLTNKVISLQSETVRDYWTERKLVVTLPEQKINRTIVMLQFTSWPGSLFPNPQPVVEYIKEIIEQYDQQTHFSHPILVHCSSGIGRTGLFILLTVLVSETMANGSPLPDLTQLAMKLSCSRKNILRDREHLKFAYNAFLHYIKQLHKSISKPGLEVVEHKEEEREIPANDPLSTLDPLWATKRPS